MLANIFSDNSVCSRRTFDTNIYSYGIICLYTVVICMYHYWKSDSLSKLRSYKLTNSFSVCFSENNTYETIGPGSSIGFSSLLFGLPSLNNVCTLTHCVLIYINVQTFNAALQQAPLLYRTVYRTRQLILAKYQSNYEVKMIENPHYTKRKRRLKLKYKNLNQRLIKNGKYIINNPHYFYFWQIVLAKENKFCVFLVC